MINFIIAYIFLNRVLITVLTHILIDTLFNFFLSQLPGRPPVDVSTLALKASLLTSTDE